MTLGMTRARSEAGQARSATGRTAGLLAAGLLAAALTAPLAPTAAFAHDALVAADPAAGATVTSLEQPQPASGF